MMCAIRIGGKNCTGFYFYFVLNFKHMLAIRMRQHRWWWCCLRQCSRRQHISADTRHNTPKEWREWKQNDDRQSEPKRTLASILRCILLYDVCCTMHCAVGAFVVIVVVFSLALSSALSAMHAGNEIGWNHCTFYEIVYFRHLGSFHLSCTVSSTSPSLALSLFSNDLFNRFNLMFIVST